MASPQRTTKAGLPLQAQVPIDGFIVDFACFYPKLAIEIDGSQHSQKQRSMRDAARDAYLTTSGFSVLRFWNCDVDRNLDGVMTLILSKLEMT